MKKDEFKVLIGVHVKITELFSIKLERHIIDLKELGIHKTKSQLISELAEIGLQSEKI